MRIESERNYVRVHTTKADYRLRKTLAELTEELDPAHFVRTNRAMIVSLSHVREVQTWFRGDRLSS